MYYSGGNFEAFAHAKKQKGAEEKKVYIIGSGMASLSTACFLIRDGHIPGSNITIFEKSSHIGGVNEGYNEEKGGYILEGGREMASHYEVLWDLLRSIPSLETEGATVLDDIYWLAKEDPNCMQVRSISERGEELNTDFKNNLSDEGINQIIKLFFTPDAELLDKRINDVFTDEVFTSNFWCFWSRAFIFKPSSSALEFKSYLQRFIHSFDKIPDQSVMIYGRYNQYDSIMAPIISWLKDQGVVFSTDTSVKDVKFKVDDTLKEAVSMTIVKDGKDEVIQMGEKELLFIANGSSMENTSIGGQEEAAVYDPEVREGGNWDLWEKISVQDNDFGNPAKFYSYPDETKWISATVTTKNDMIPPYVKAVTRREVFDGKTVTGGAVSIADSSWKLCFSVGRQPQFKTQEEGQMVAWLYALNGEEKGDFVDKPMYECTGREICMEWLYHLGVPAEDIEKAATEGAVTIPVISPFLMSYFIPRALGDKPDVVPMYATNFAFVGQFARTDRDTVFTIEYSVRTAMEAVYKLLDVDRAVPEVWASIYDVRDILSAAESLTDGRNMMDINRPGKNKKVAKEVLKLVHGTDIEDFLDEYNWIK